MNRISAYVENGESKLSLDVQVRWLIRRDVAAVLDIETASFAAPWNEDELLLRLRKKSVIGRVAVIDNCTVGYVLYELRRGVLDILRLAVAPEFRRRGVGSRIIEAVKDRAPIVNRSSVTFAVRESNLTAQLFLRHCGFLAHCTMDEYFEDGEDAYLFKCELPMCEQTDR